MRDRIRQRPCPIRPQPCRRSRRKTVPARMQLLPPLLLLTTTLLLLDVAPVVVVVVAVQLTTVDAADTDAATVSSTDTISSAIIDRLLEEDENNDGDDDDVQKKKQQQQQQQTIETRRRRQQQQQQQHDDEEDDEQDILDDSASGKRRRRQQSQEDIDSGDKLGSGSDDDTDRINPEEEHSSPEKKPQQPPDDENDDGDEAQAQDLGDDRVKQKLDSQPPPQSVLPTTRPHDNDDIQDDVKSEQQPSSVPTTEVDENISSRKDDDGSTADQEDKDQEQDQSQQKHQNTQALDDNDQDVDVSEDDGSYGDKKVKPSSSSQDDDQKDATTTNDESKRDNIAEDISTDTSSGDDIAEDHDTTTTLDEEAQQQHHTQQKDDNDADDNNKEGKQQYAYDEYPVDDTAVELDLEDDASTATKRATAKDTTKTKQDDDNKSSDRSSTSDDDDDDGKTVVPDENEGDEAELTSKEEGVSMDDNDTAKQDDNESDEPPEPPESNVDIIPDDATKEDIVKDEEDSSQNVTAVIGDDEENTDDSNAEVGDEDDEPISSQFSVDYASKSAGALIIDKSHDFKGTSNLLNGDKDKYAITPCQEKKKFVVLSLSEDILVKEIKLANYERFASTMKNIQVMGSQTLGTRTWFDLGNYTARPGLGEQDFAVEKPAWARYLKFKFRTHHGMEYYCTLSQIQVHGSTMVQGFHEQWELIEEENEEEEKSTEENVDATKVQNELKDATGDLSMNETNAEGVDISEGEKEHPSNQTAELSPEDSTDASQAQADTHFGKRPTQEDIAAIAVLDAFASSSALFEVLQGRCVNEDLYPDMYTHLPTTLESVPRSMVRSASEKSTAVNGKNDSQYYTIRTKQLQSSTTPEVGDKDSSMIALGSTESISSPKMSEFSSNLGETVSPTSTFRFNFTWDIRARLAHLWNSTVGDKSNEDSQGQIPDPTQDNGGKKIDVQSNAQPEPKHEDISDSEIVIETLGDSVAMDQAFIQLLQDLPSAECLANLDFSAFKAKFSSTRKKSVFSGGPGNSVMEPIFKKLTDEIFALQTSVSVHDQFTKATIACYQRVLLDLMVEMTKMKNGSLDRITRLEEQMLEWRLQRALNFIIDLVLRTGNWTISKLYLAVIFAAEQYPSIEKAVGQTFSRFVEWSTRVGIPRCRQARSTVVRFTTMLFDRFVAFAFGPEGLDILATPQTNEVPSPFFGSKDSMIEEFLNGRQSFDSSPVTAEDMTWIFPVVPILLLLLTLRILMCFAPSYTATKMVYWPSPARIANSRSPRSDPRSVTPRSGRSSRSHNTSTPNSGNEIQRSNSPKKLPGTLGSEIRNISHENIPALMDEKFAAVDVKAESILSGRIQSPSSSDAVEGNQQPQQNRTPGIDQESRRHSGHLNGGGGGGGGGHDEPSIVVSPSVVSVDSQPKTN